MNVAGLIVFYDIFDCDIRRQDLHLAPLLQVFVRLSLCLWFYWADEWKSWAERKGSTGYLYYHD